MFGIDLETGGLAPDAELRLVQISNGEDTFVIDVRESDPRPLLEEFAGNELIAHNASLHDARVVECHAGRSRSCFRAVLLFTGRDSNPSHEHPARVFLPEARGWLPRPFRSRS
jgi:hypothetical protein